MKQQNTLQNRPEIINPHSIHQRSIDTEILKNQHTGRLPFQSNSAEREQHQALSILIIPITRADKNHFVLASELGHH